MFLAFLIIYIGIAVWFAMYLRKHKDYDQFKDEIHIFLIACVLWPISLGFLFKEYLDDHDVDDFMEDAGKFFTKFQTKVVEWFKK